MFNVRPNERWPWLWIEPPIEDVPGFRVTPPEAEDPPGLHLWSPPKSDPPGFRIATDGSARGDIAFAGPGAAVGLSPPPRIGFAVEDRLPKDNPFNFLDRHSPSSPLGDMPPSPQISPIYSWMMEASLKPKLQGYLDNVDARRDTPLAAGDTGLRTDDDATAWRVLSDTFGPRAFEYNRRNEKSSLASEPTRRIGGENRLSLDPYDPTYLASSLRNPLQEAFDQLSRIYAAVGLDPLSRFDGQRSGIRPTMLRGNEVSPAIGDAFDPRYVVPAQSPGGPTRPPPGRGDNNPPRSQAPLDPRPGTVAPFPPRPTPEQPAPSPAGAAAAAEAALRKREEAYKTHREHLQQLAPDHPLLKLEPLSGVVPDQPTVDRYGDEVRGIVRKKIDRTIEDLSARSIYDQRSAVRTIGGDVDLRAEFERLKSVGKRVDGGRGQYGREGELYELPGGVLVGYRMANDMRTGQKRSVPTLDVRYPDGTWVRFHYNTQR